MDDTHGDEPARQPREPRADQQPRRRAAGPRGDQLHIGFGTCPGPHLLGELERQPQLAKPLHELAATPLNPRAAFLLSRIDGTLSLDEILDVSGMPRMEAYRYLCQLFLRGVLK